MPDLWELEAAQIEAECSVAAMDELWCEVLAGLRGCTDDRMADLALAAQEIAGMERDPALRAYLEERIDVIVYERRAALRRAPAEGQEGSC